MAHINGKNVLFAGLKGDSVFIRYSANADGTDFTDTWREGLFYIGVATGQTAPQDKNDYTWCKFTDELIGLVDRVSDLEFAVGCNGVSYVTKENTVIPENTMRYAKILNVSCGAYIRNYNLFPMPYAVNTGKGAAYEIHSDGSIDIDCTNSGALWLLNSKTNFYVEPDKYRLTGASKSALNYLTLIAYNGSKEVASFTDTGGGVDVDLSGKIYTRLSLRLTWDAMADTSTALVCPQLVKAPANINAKFEPYTLKVPYVKKIQVVKKSSGEVICEREIPAEILAMPQYTAGNCLSFDDKQLNDNKVILPANEQTTGELLLTDYVNSLWERQGASGIDISDKIKNFDPFIEVASDCEINIVTVDDKINKEFCKVAILYQIKAVN